MKSKIFDKSGKASREINKPEVFSGKIREDILARVFESQKRRQPTGSKIGAGAGYSASGIVRHKRHAWKTAYGKGISRIPRKIMSRHGSSFNWVGATVASTRGGRRAHPPKAQENQFRKINKKELKIAFISALSGAANKRYLEKKYNVITSTEFPVIFDRAILNEKSKEFFQTIKQVLKEFEGKILKEKTVRPGRGKLRGRKYKSNAGLLFVIGNDETMKRTGIDVVKVKDLEIRDLSPNGVPGRISCYTEKAVEEIKNKFENKPNVK